MNSSVRNQEGQQTAPLAKCMIEHAARGLLRCHFPGHKGRTFSTEGEEILGRSLKHDLTEVEGLDDLAAPYGPIRDAQALASLAFGADHTFFLVGGASAGIMAAVWAAAQEGSTVALPRSSHRSVISALVLSGVRPLWVKPHSLPGVHMPLPVSFDELDLPGASAVVILSPTYEGLCVPLVGGAESDRVESDCVGGREGTGSADRRGAERPIIIVDEAHGSHFYFSEKMPRGWLTAGADACVHGAHKTLGSLTGSGFLHLKGPRLDRARCAQALAAIQTTSPSYLMMASLDLTRRDMVLHGEELLDGALCEAGVSRQALSSAGIEYLRLEAPGDPLKLVLPSPQFGVSGPDLASSLRENGVEVEYAGLLHVVAVFSIGDLPGAGLRFAEAVKRVARATASGGHPGDGRIAGPGTRPHLDAALHATRLLSGMGMPEQSISPRQAFQAGSRTVPIEHTVGYVSAESVYTYPPGAALLVQGEIVPSGFPEMVRSLSASRIHFQGPGDLSLDTLRIVEDPANAR